MSRITAYQATDGSLHRDKKAYRQHEQNLQAGVKIRELIGAAVAASDGTPEGDAARKAAIENQASVIFDTIGLNQLRDILNAPLVLAEADAGGQEPGASQAPADGEQTANAAENPPREDI